MGAAGGMMGLSLFSGWVTGMQNQEMYKAQADQAEENAFKATQLAKDAVERGEIESEMARARGWAFAGTQKAVMGTSGVEMTSGSFLNVLEDTYSQAEYDALVRKTNAAREAWGYGQEAYGFEQQHAMLSWQGNNALLSGMLGGASAAGQTYLGGGGSGAYTGRSTSSAGSGSSSSGSASQAGGRSGGTGR
jgi:hypothetical protein